MDAKDLRTETTIGERSNNGSNKFAQGGAATPSIKPYESISTNPLAKLETPTSRPCAVIGPDRIVPPPNGDAFSKKSQYEPWLHVDNTYRQPPEYPHKLPSYQSPIRNISPRQTFQENMQRIMVQPTYNSVKLSDDPNYALDRNTAKSSKLTGPHEPKYCDVPYSVNPISDQKQNEMCVNNMNTSRTYPQMWHPGSVGIRPARPYGAPDLYQFPDYSNCAAPRPMPMARPHRTINEDPNHPYSETYYPEGNIRFKPYPTIKERYQQTRYEYLSNYGNAFHPPPPFPTHKYDLQKPLPPHVTYPQVPIKYLDNRMTDAGMDGYQRPQPVNYNLPYRNQVIHPAYGPMIGSNIPNKVYPYPPDAAVKSMAPNKLPYDNKLYTEYENARNRGYPLPDTVYPHMKNQPILPNYAASNMQPVHTHAYYRKENFASKSYEYMSHLRHLDPSLNPNTLARLSTQFSPGAIAISPSDSNTSNETSHTHGGSLEDCGYVSQSSSASARSYDSVNRMMPSDFHQRYNYPYQAMVRSVPLSSKPEEMNACNPSKDKKEINVRQFLQMWNEGEDENGGKEKEVVTQSDYNSSKVTNQYDTMKSNDQLYVLGLVNVPSEELSKYEHIQKISKLPENIKGYNNIELLKHFEEAIESSNISNTNQKPFTPRNHHPSIKSPFIQGPGMFPSRPISPLDVEAKISQSVIHKEVGCNFEIKPCSPVMLNAEVATTAQSILGDERVIEKVTNPINVNSPILKSTAENDKIPDDMNEKVHRIMLKDDCNTTASCKMINTQCSNNDDASVAKSNYSIQDLESNAGVCLASLPRLDNDIELNFPEVNQQFINANKESVIIANDFTSEINASPHNNNHKINEHLNLPTENASSLIPILDADTEVSKLSKFRKIKKNDVDYNEKQFLLPPQSLRTDSVIIKNPENIKSVEKNTETSTLKKTTVNDIKKPISDNSNQHNINNSKDTNEIAIDFSFSRLDCNPIADDSRNIRLARSPNLEPEKLAVDHQVPEDANTACNLPSSSEEERRDSTYDITIPKSPVHVEVNDIDMRRSVTENFLECNPSKEVGYLDIKECNEIKQPNVMEYTDINHKENENNLNTDSVRYEVDTTSRSDEMVSNDRNYLTEKTVDELHNKSLESTQTTENSSTDNVSEQFENSILVKNTPVVLEKGTVSKTQSTEIITPATVVGNNCDEENNKLPSTECDLTKVESDGVNRCEDSAEEVVKSKDVIEPDGTNISILPERSETKNSSIKKGNLRKELFSPQIQNLLLWSEGRCINLTHPVCKENHSDIFTDQGVDNSKIKSKIVDADMGVCYKEIEVRNVDELLLESLNAVQYSHHYTDGNPTVMDKSSDNDDASIILNSKNNDCQISASNDIPNGNFVSNLAEQPNLVSENMCMKDCTISNADTTVSAVYVSSLQTVEVLSTRKIQSEPGIDKEHPFNSPANNFKDFMGNENQSETTYCTASGSSDTNNEVSIIDGGSTDFQSAGKTSPSMSELAIDSSASNALAVEYETPLVSKSTIRSICDMDVEPSVFNKFNANENSSFKPKSNVMGTNNGDSIIEGDSTDLQSATKTSPSMSELAIDTSISNALALKHETPLVSKSTIRSICGMDLESSVFDKLNANENSSAKPYSNVMDTKNEDSVIDGVSTNFKSAAKDLDKSSPSMSELATDTSAASSLAVEHETPLVSKSTIRSICDMDVESSVFNKLSPAENSLHSSKSKVMVAIVTNKDDDIDSNRNISNVEILETGTDPINSQLQPGTSHIPDLNVNEHCPRKNDGLEPYQCSITDSSANKTNIDYPNNVTNDVKNECQSLSSGDETCRVSMSKTENYIAEDLNTKKDCVSCDLQSETTRVKDCLLSDSRIETSDDNSISEANSNAQSDSESDGIGINSDVDAFPVYENSQLQPDCSDSKDFPESLSYAETFNVDNSNLDTADADLRQDSKTNDGKHCILPKSDFKMSSSNDCDCVGDSKESNVVSNYHKNDSTHFSDILHASEANDNNTISIKNYGLQTSSPNDESDIHVDSCNIQELDLSSKVSVNSNSPHFNQNCRQNVDHMEMGADLYEVEAITEDSAGHDNESRKFEEQIFVGPEELFVRRGLKRSLSDSELSYRSLDDGLQNGIELHNLRKRRKNNPFVNIGDAHFSATDVLNVHNNRRNSISSVYNEENMPICIVIDNNCIITEESEDGEKLCYTEIPEACLAGIHTNEFEQTSEIVLCPQVNNNEYEEPFVLQISNEKSLEESWVDDVACVETVVSDDIAEDIELSAPSSPEEINEQDNEESEIFAGVSEHAEKVKYIYGDKMCNDDAELVETLYRTPQMDVNKTLINRECYFSDDEDALKENSCHLMSPLHDLEAESISVSDSKSENVVKTISSTETGHEILNEKNNNLKNQELSETSLPQDAAKDEPESKSMSSPEHNLLNENNARTEARETSQDISVNSCESSIDNVFSYNQDENMSDYPVFSSPEVSSTTSEERNSSLLLKITNRQGTRTSQLNDIALPKKNSCKFTENINYTNFISKSTEPRPLITKAAQKYIPPLKESVEDFKVKIHLPHESLIKFKQLKNVRTVVRHSAAPKNDIPKKPKPKFEDVLKSIDELQFKMHREKSKKPKKTIPKVVIKKTENGSHYASTTKGDCYNPDLTGRKWQPWVFIEKNNFIDKMALRKKFKAIYNHRSNTYVFADKFKKYKSMQSAKFVITQPKLDHNSSVGQLKYTIRLKHSY